MSRLSRILEGGAEPEPRHVRRRVGTVVIIVLAALMGWAVFKNVATGDLADVEIEAGIDDLTQAVQQQDPAAFEAAEEHFVDAASVSVLDRYPAFLISTTRKIASPAQGQNSSTHDAIARLVAAKDLVGARERAKQLEADSAQAGQYWLRLLDDIELRLDQ